MAQAVPSGDKCMHAEVTSGSKITAASRTVTVDQKTKTDHAKQSLLMKEQRQMNVRESQSSNSDCVAQGKPCVKTNKNIEHIEHIKSQESVISLGGSEELFDDNSSSGSGHSKSDSIPGSKDNEKSTKLNNDGDHEQEEHKQIDKMSATASVNTPPASLGGGSTGGYGTMQTRSPQLEAYLLGAKANTGKSVILLHREIVYLENYFNVNNRCIVIYVLYLNVSPCVLKIKCEKYNCSEKIVGRRGCLYFVSVKFQTDLVSIIFYTERSY